MGTQDFGIFLTEIYYLFKWLQLLFRFHRSFFLIGYLGLIKITPKLKIMVNSQWTKMKK